MIKLKQIIVLGAVKNSANENYASLLEKKKQTMDMFKYTNYCGENILPLTKEASYDSDNKMVLLHK